MEKIKGREGDNWVPLVSPGKTVVLRSGPPKVEVKTFSTKKSEDDSETGALIYTNYVGREQTVVGVSKDDLEHLLSFDAREMGKFTFGMFLLSGSAWLLIEEIVRQPELEFTTLVWVCVLCVVFGLIFIGDGYLERMRKRRTIKNIFSQTRQ